TARHRRDERPGVGSAGRRRADDVAPRRALLPLLLGRQLPGRHVRGRLRDLQDGARAVHGRAREPDPEDDVPRARARPQRADRRARPDVDRLPRVASEPSGRRARAVDRPSRLAERQTGRGRTHVRAAAGALSHPLPQFRRDVWAPIDVGTFRVPAEWGERTLIRFGAVDWRATVYLDGEPLGAHEGGYTHFTIDAGHLEPGSEHVLVVES